MEEALHAGAVKNVPVIQHLLQLAGRHSRVFQIAEQIGELQADKLHILFLYQTHDIFLCIVTHMLSPFL